ncbi:MAG: DUF5915 domain-containing protein, partial [Flavobacteriaceae bacterium]
GWQVAQGNGLTVALDMTLSPELQNEGMARELVNRIQNLRKDSGLEVTDKIEVSLVAEPKLKAALSENIKYILSETLADKLEYKTEIKDGLTVEFDAIKTKIQIKKIS